MCYNVLFGGRAVNEPALLTNPQHCLTTTVDMENNYTIPQNPPLSADLMALPALSTVPARSSPQFHIRVMDFMLYRLLHLASFCKHTAFRYNRVF